MLNLVVKGNQFIDAVYLILQMIDIQTNINLRRDYVIMPKEILNESNRKAHPIQMSGNRTPKQMRMNPFAKAIETKMLNLAMNSASV